MTAAEENYVHFTECIESLTNAWRTLKELESVPLGVVRAAAYRAALIDYAKPYKRSDGTHKRGRDGYILPVPSLTSDERLLHDQILDLRDQVLAHSDLTLKDARVYASRVQGQPFVAIGISRLPTFPDTPAVIALVERSLESMKLQLEQLDEAIAPKA